jgi:hypothetical protein
MNTHTYGLALDVGDTDLSLVARPSGSWLPPALRVGRTLDPQLWRMRAARGLTWHRTGKAFRRDHADYAR